MILSIIVFSKAQSNIWVKQLNAIDLKLVKLTEDDQANLFIAGMFKDSLQLDSQTLVVGPGNFQVFIAKYDAAQHLLDYTILYTDYEFERPMVQHLEVDKDGAIYLVGNFYQGLYNAQGDTLLFTLTSLDEYVVKFDNDLIRQWIHRIGGSNNTDIISTLEITNEGEIILAGAMSRTFDYDLSDTTFAISGNNLGSPFIVKYDSEARLKWASVLQSARRDWVLDAVPATDGSLYSVTQLSDTLIVPSAEDTLLVEPLGDVDLMVNKWDDHGQIVWTKLIRGTGAESFYNLKIDNAGFIYLLAQFNSPVLQVGDQEINQHSGNDIIVVKMDSEATIIWVNQINATSSDIQLRLLMLENEFAVTGKYSNDLILNSRGESVEIAIASGDDYLASYNLDGDLLAAGSLSNRNMPQKSDLRLNRSGQILAASSITFEASFNPLPVGSITPRAGSNYIVAKFCLPAPADLMVESFCQDGQLILTADVRSEITNFYFPESKTSVLNQVSIVVSSEDTTIVIIHFDQNYCPVYQTINDLVQICTSTPTADFAVDHAFMVYPNPFVNQLSLSLDGPQNIHSIRCFDQLGRLVLDINNSNFGNKIEHQLDLSFLREGIYHIQVQTDVGIWSKTLIKS
jgi:hypothetical protein